MLRILDLDERGKARVREGDPGLVGPAPRGHVRWIDLEAQTPEDLALLGERFGFHPLTLEDCDHLDQRPKIEQYEGYAFIVIHGFLCPDADPGAVELLEVHAFLLDDTLVTVHAKPVAAVELVWKRVAAEPGGARRGPDFLYYLIADGIVDENFTALDLVSDEIDKIEEVVLDQPKKKDLERIFELKRAVVTMRRVLVPQRDVFALLSKGNLGTLLEEKTAFYFRDVYDHHLRIYESIDVARDLLSNALDAYLSMVGQRTNEVMKSLTLLSVIFLPLTFLTGFFGQNFDGLPFHSPAFMWAAMAACAVLPAVMLLWFRSKRWME